MRGIDVSRYDGRPFKSDTATAYKDSDFVIVKATQGVNYAYTSYFNWAIDKVIKDGKLAGAYHYAAGNDATKEADYFISIVKPYIGEIVLALDWESIQNKAWGNKTWCKTFIDRVKEKTGVTCFLYTGMDGIKQCTNLANTVPLWFAGYPRNDNSWTIPKWPNWYSTKPWTQYTIWQFTSGNEKVDRNVSNMSIADWNKYAGIKASTSSTTATLSDSELLTLVVNTLKGKYGNGDTRKNALKANYGAVQEFINHIAESSINTLVQETLAGKYGNGSTRKTLLGSKYAAVQKEINKQLEK